MLRLGKPVIFASSGVGRVHSAVVGSLARGEPATASAAAVASGSLLLDRADEAVSVLSVAAARSAVDAADLAASSLMSLLIALAPAVAAAASPTENMRRLASDVLSSRVAAFSFVACMTRTCVIRVCAVGQCSYYMIRSVIMYGRSVRVGADAIIDGGVIFGDGCAVERLR